LKNYAIFNPDLPIVIYPNRYNQAHDHARPSVAVDSKRFN